MFYDDYTSSIHTELLSLSVPCSISEKVQIIAHVLTESKLKDSTIRYFLQTAILLGKLLPPEVIMNNATPQKTLRTNFLFGCKFLTPAAGSPRVLLPKIRKLVFLNA